MTWDVLMFAVLGALVERQYRVAKFVGDADVLLSPDARAGLVSIAAPETGSCMPQRKCNGTAVWRIACSRRSLWA